MSAANAALAMPYPGLRPFEDEDQPLFFGREAQISAMLLQLEDHRFVAVVGSSGSGKSSLVRAGLLPAVREGFLLGTTDWLTIIIKPGHQPYQRLVRALSLATCRTDGSKVIPAYDDPLAPNEIATLAKLRRTDRGLLTALGQLAISPQSRVMVVVDQFEELFAFRRAGVNRDTVASRDEAAAFVGMLIRSASDPAGRIWAVLTMRSDFIGDCEAFLGLPEEISRSQFLVPRLDRGQMEEAIARPAAVEEGAFKTFTFDEGLVNRIINDAGDRPDQLPLMQHALMRTWKHAVAGAGADGPVTVTPEDYEAAGGIEMALSLHADAAWDEIKDHPKKAHIARRLFLLLCDISPDGQITRRRPQVAEVEAVTGASVAEIEQVVRVFQQDDRNFLLPPPPFTPESYLDSSHEALLRQWRLFAGEWQEQERRDASELRRLVELASLRKQGQGGLLPAQDLERIDRWKERVSAEWAHRYVTKEAWAEAISFVEESRTEVKRQEEQRQKQSRQKRALVRLVAIILIVATTISMIAMFQALNSEKKARNSEKEAKISAVRSKDAKTAAQVALTRTFLRTIGIFAESRPPPSDERAALWELAELDPANAPVRKIVIDHWVKGSIERALNRNAQGLHAAIGLDVAQRKHFASKAKELAERLARDMEGVQEISDEPSSSMNAGNEEALVLNRLRAFGYVSKVGHILAALAARMEPKDAASIAARGAQVLAKALEKVQETDTDLGGGALVLAMLEEARGTDTDLLSSWGNALAGLAARMEPNDAASVAARLTKALEDPQKTDAVRLSNWGNALVALAARMEPKDAASFAQVVAKALENPKETDTHRLSSLGNSLVALAARMEPKDAASFAQVVAKALENPKETDTHRLSSLGNALVGLTARMEPKDATSFAQVVAKALENPKETDTDRLSNLGNALAGLTARMEPRDAASVAARGAQVVAKALENPKETDTDRLSSLGNALVALTARMEPRDAANVAARGALAKALENPKGTDTDRLSSLGNALAGLTARMEPKDAASGAARGAQVLTTALANPEQTVSSNLSSLGWSLGGLSRLIPHARQTQLAALSNMLLEEVSGPPEQGEEEPEKRRQLADLYALLAAQDLAEILKWPFCAGEAEKIALAELEKKTGRKFGGDIWKFVEQAPSLGIKNLDAPAKRPKVEDALKELKSVTTGGEVSRSSDGE